MKNIFLITFLIFIYSCGYTSVYKNLEKQDYIIIVTETTGDRKMNNLIKNEINLYSNKDSQNKFEITLDTEFKKSIVAKDTSGTATDYKLSTTSEFTIYYDEKSQKMTFNESINIKSKTDTFEQNLYEDNIKRNFASTIRGKLMLEIINLK